MITVDTYADMCNLCNSITDDNLGDYMRITINEEDFKDIQSAINDALCEDVSSYGVISTSDVLKELFYATKYVVEDIGFDIFKDNLYNRDFPLLLLQEDESYLENVQRSMAYAVCEDTIYAFSQEITKSTGKDPLNDPWLLKLKE